MFDPNQLFHRAHQFQLHGQLDQAREFYEKILRSFPEHLGALTMLGILSVDIGDNAKGIKLLSESLKFDPNQYWALNALGVAYLNIQKYQDACNVFSNVLNLNRNYIDAHFNLGNCYKKMGKYLDAISSYSSCIKLSSDYADAYFNRGSIYLENLREPAKALTDFSAFLRLKPNSFFAKNSIGRAHKELNQLDLALKSYDEAIHLKPNYAEAYLNRAVTFNELKRFDEAIADCNQAIHLKPNYAEAYLIKARAFHGRYQFDEAVFNCNQAINANPVAIAPYINLGVIFHELKQFDKAIAAFNRAIEIDSKDAEANYNLGLTLLSSERFERGWELFDYRFLIGDKGYLFLETNKPQWDGTFSNDRLFIWAEQGIGDQIIFASMFHELEKMNQKITISVDKRLIPIFERSFPRISFVDQELGCREENYDEHFPMGSLGKLFRKNINDFPAVNAGYLLVNPVSKELIQKNPLFDKSTCGLSWMSTNKKFGVNKTISLNKFSDLLKVKGFNFINLQYGNVEAELLDIEAKFGLNLISIDDVDLFADIDSTLSLIDCCDVVVTVSNSVAHLAGSIGKETLLLLPNYAGRFWYWNEKRESSLWYPSVKIFSQPEAGGWETPIFEIIKYLEEGLCPK